MRGVTFRRDNPVRTRICLLTPLSGFCPDLYLGERPILGRSCPDLYLEYNRIVRGPAVRHSMKRHRAASPPEVCT